MYRKLIYLISIVLVLGMAAGATGDLVGHWMFDEGLGTTTVDSSGNNYDGTFTGDVQWSNDGVYGTCLQFSGGVGIRSYVEAVNSGEIEFGNADISISVWIKTTATKEMTILTNVRNSGHHSIDMEQTPTLGVNRDDVHIGKVSYDNVFVTSIDSLATVNDGEWHHVALVQSHSFAGTEGWTLYIDGNPDAKKSLDNDPDAGGQRLRIGGGVSHPSFSNSFIGLIDDIRIYNHVLSEAEVMSLAIGESDFAFRQNPADVATDVPRDVFLSWMPGNYADKHDVYFGTNFDDVNDAGRTNPLDVLVSRNQDANSYSPAELLQFGQTYYWRIDEVNAPPDYTIYKGSVWSFTAELFAHPMPSENIAATASSSSSANEGPENTVNGSGLDANDLHSVETTDMWLSSTTGPQPTWIQYEFDKVYKLYEMWVWNHNSSVESFVGFGVKDANVEYSTDGNDWMVLGDFEFARGPGTAGYAHITTVDLGGVAAKYFKITANSNWGGIMPQYGLSEVRFFYIPVFAIEPDPASGTTDMDVDNVTLSWRKGREAASHDVHLSTNEQTVIDCNALIVSVSEASYVTGELQLNQNYYWKIVEVNEAETPTNWQGNVWNFTTREFLVVDDFDDYNNFSPDRVFQRWIDGVGYSADEFFPVENPGNGSGAALGHNIWSYDSPHYNGDIMETAIVHGGGQSAPLYYTGLSEIERTFDVAQDWTKHGIKTLTLYFYGDPNNVAQQMYVKLNGSKAVYTGDVADIQQASWKQWDIDLASFDVDLWNVAKIAIGFGDETHVEPGGSGVVYFDDIRLYPALVEE